MSPHLFRLNASKISLAILSQIFVFVFAVDCPVQTAAAEQPIHIKPEMLAFLKKTSGMMGVATGKELSDKLHHPAPKEPVLIKANQQIGFSSTSGWSAVRPFRPDDMLAYAGSNDGQESLPAPGTRPGNLGTSDSSPGRTAPSGSVLDPARTAEFRGVKPGVTTRAQLLARMEWQSAFTAEQKLQSPPKHPHTSFLREYVFKPWKSVSVIIVDDTVRAIDFLPPDSTNYVPAQLAQVMQLGELVQQNVFPKSARFGVGEDSVATVLQSNTHRALFLLEKFNEDQTRLARVRLYAASPAEPPPLAGTNRPTPNPSVPVPESLLPTPGQSTDPPPTNKLAFSFRGVVPGETTLADLRANDRWGEPIETSTSDDGELLRYRIRGYPEVRVLIRRGRVQTVDVSISDGVSEELAARTFNLGEPQNSPLPESALIGPATPSEKWAARSYSAGRIVLYVENNGAESLARMMRFYAGSVSEGPHVIPLNLGESEIRIRGQDDQSRQVVKYVVEFLDKYDYMGHKLDEEMSREWMERFLLQLDGTKTFLLEEDVERFRKMAPTIGDRARQGDIGFAYDAFETWIKRREEVAGLVAELLTARHDFTLDEELSLTGPQTPWPENQIESREIWRKQVKHQVLIRRLAGASDEQAVDKVRRYYQDQFRLPRRMNDGTLLEWTLTALGNARGGTAKFYSPHSLEENRSQMRGSMVGIGAQLSMVDGEVVITSLILGGPAHADGRLSPEDVIVAVGQDETEPMVNLAGLRLEESVGIIRGPAGSTVRLTIRPKNGGNPFTIRLRRDSISLVSVRGSTLQVPGSGRKIGWIASTTFYNDDAGGRSSVRDITRILGDFRSQAVEAVILDLRSCSGGPLQESIDVFGLFADGPVVLSKDLTGRIQTHRPQHTVNVTWSGPLVVLISHQTGSGAALVAAAAKNHERGIIVGDNHSFPDAQIQNILDLGQELVKSGNPPNLGAIRYTSYILYQLDGSSPHGRGVLSDLHIPSFTGYSTLEMEAKQIVPDALSPAKYAPLGMVSPQTIQTLVANSQLRRQASPLFAEMEQLIERLRERSERRRESLNEEVRRAEQLPRFDNELPKMTADDFISHGPYVDEVLAITQDYVQSIAWHSDYLQGWEALSNGQTEAAIKAFDSAIATAGNAGAPYLGRAYAQAATSNWKEAVDDMKKSGSEGLRVEVVADAELKVSDKVVATVKPGNYLFITNHNAKWVWASLSDDRSISGWIEQTAVRPKLP